MHQLIKTGNVAGVDLDLGGARSALLFFQEHFQTHGVIAGGFLRDQVHNKPIKDIDIFIEFCPAPSRMPEYDGAQAVQKGKEYSAVNSDINAVYEYDTEPYRLNLIFLKGALDMSTFPLNISRISWSSSEGFTVGSMYRSKTLVFTDKGVDQHHGGSRFNTYVRKICHKYPLHEYEYIFSQNPEVLGGYITTGQRWFRPVAIEQCRYLTAEVSEANIPLISDALLSLMEIFGRTTYLSQLSPLDVSHLVSSLYDLASRLASMKSSVPQELMDLVSSSLDMVTSAMQSALEQGTKETGSSQSRITTKMPDFISNTSTSQTSATDGRQTIGSQRFSTLFTEMIHSRVMEWG